MNTSLDTRTETALAAGSATRPHRIAVRAAFALVALLAPLLTFQQPAQAVGTVNVLYQPGRVTVNLPMTAAYDQNLPTAGYPRLFRTNGMVVRRSPASTGTQTVVAYYVLQRFDNGAWRDINTSPTYSGTVWGTRTLTFPAWNVAPQQLIRSAGYRFAYVIGWYSGGRVLGYEVLYPNRNGENACHTLVRRCTAYHDGVVI